MFLKPNGQDWAWRYYDSFWAWLRHGVVLKWHCAQCGKRHLSSRFYFDDHIDFDVPLCTRCQDEAWVGYNETMRQLSKQDVTLRGLTLEEQAALDANEVVEWENCW